jgi:outer membrane immunogenic protein
MLKYLIVPAAVAGTLATPAFAQDEAPPAPTESASAPFTGAHVEVLAGYDESLVYGLGAGYDYQTGRLVFGLQGEASDSTDKACFNSLIVAGDRLCSSQDRNLYVGGRIGVAVAPATLLYGKVGYSNLRLTTAYTGPPGGLGSFRVASDLDGVRVGAGIEQKIGRNAFIRGEYRYSDYEGGSRIHDGVAAIGFRF